MLHSKDMIHLLRALGLGESILNERSVTLYEPTPGILFLEAACSANDFLGLLEKLLIGDFIMVAFDASPTL